MLITVCIPFYNDDLFLEKAILSVLNQTYKDWLLILLHDGGTDGSLSIAQKFTYDPRIKLISDGKNRGLIYRLNQSVEMARTKYYARMDADDIMHPERIKRQLEILEKNEHIDVLGTAAYSIDKDDRIRGVRGKYDNELIPCKGFIHPSITGRTSWFKTNKYNSLAERFEDYELWRRTAHTSSFYTINEPLLYYREYGGEYYKKYIKTFNSSLRYCINSPHANYFRNIGFSFMNLIKGVCVYFLYLFKCEDYLIKKRFNPISSSAEYYKARLNLEKSQLKPNEKKNN